MVFDVKQPWVYISANVCTDRKRASQKQNPLQLSPDKFQGKTRPRCMWMWNLQEEGRSLPSCYYCAWWWALCLLPWSLELVVTLNWVFTLPFTESHMHQKHRGSQFSERRICADTDTNTHTTCTSTRVSNQREEIHFLYILRFPGFLMAQKREFWTAKNASVATFHEKDGTQNSQVLKIRQEKLWKLENCHPETMFLRMRNGNDKKNSTNMSPSVQSHNSNRGKDCSKTKGQGFSLQKQCTQLGAWSRKKQQTLFLEVNENLHRDY